MRAWRSAGARRAPRYRRRKCRCRLAAAGAARAQDQLSDLRGIDKQIERVEQNARQFIDGKAANNVPPHRARAAPASPRS
jgi:predicted AAA+ superfamily ATPase